MMLLIPVGATGGVEVVDWQPDLAGHKSMAMTKHYDHTREERCGGVIEALVVARTVTPQNSVACFHGYG